MVGQGIPIILFAKGSNPRPSSVFRKSWSKWSFLPESVAAVRGPEHQGAGVMTRRYDVPPGSSDAVDTQVGLD